MTDLYERQAPIVVPIHHPTPDLVVMRDEPPSAELHPVPTRGPAFRSIARAFTLMGILCLALTVFQWQVAGITERRSQRALRGEFDALLLSGTGLGYDATGQPVGVAPGTAVATITIPKLGVRKIVVEGTGAEELKNGPGHLVTSVLPGQPGHAIVAGRRTTYGAPFRRLDRLVAGDKIETVTPYGKFTFSVRDVRQVEPGKATDVGKAPKAMLSLLTSDPAYTGGRALVVVAVLDGEPSTNPGPPRPAASTEGGIGFSGNGDALPLALASGLLLPALLAGVGELYRRWRRWPTYLLTTPAILSVAYVWMQSLVSLLPATL